MEKTWRDINTHKTYIVFVVEQTIPLAEVIGCKMRHYHYITASLIMTLLSQKGSGYEDSKCNGERFMRDSVY